MSTALVEISIHIAVVAVLAVIAAMATGTRLRSGWLFVALALMLFRDALVLRGYGLVPEFFSAAHWNWTGKLLATAGLLLVAAMPGFGLARSGVTWQQATGSKAAWWVFAALVVVISGLAFHFRDGADTLETMLFQWSMPGIEEELFYRGVLLLALHEALDSGTSTKPRWAGLGVGGVLASVAFGLGHALFYRNGAVSFDAMAFVMTGGPALLLVWFRMRTGSLVLPVLAHNVANGAFTLL